MANYNTLFSFALTELSEDEQAWLAALLDSAGFVKQMWPQRARLFWPQLEPRWGPLEPPARMSWRGDPSGDG